MKKLDPLYWILKSLILRKFFKVELLEEESMFVMENLDKHRMVLWITIAISIGVYFGLRTIDVQNISAIIFALIAPVTVMGTAWFALSFGAIPKKLIQTSMSVTFWMYLAFMVSLSAMIISVGFITSLYIWPALGIIFIGVIISSIQYDTADGLKAGLDEAILKHSRAALIYYEKHGIFLEKEKESKNNVKKSKKINHLKK